MHAPLRHTNPGRDGNGGKQSRHAMSMDCHGLRRDVLGSQVLSVLTTPSRLHSASASRAVQPGSARAEGAGCGPATCGNPLCVSGEQSASAFPSPQLLQPLPTLPTCWGPLRSRFNRTWERVPAGSGWQWVSAVGRWLGAKWRWLGAKWRGLAVKWGCRPSQSTDRPRPGRWQPASRSGPPPAGPIKEWHVR